MSNSPTSATKKADERYHDQIENTAPKMARRVKALEAEIDRLRADVDRKKVEKLRMAYVRTLSLLWWRKGEEITHEDIRWALMLDSEDQS